MKKILSIASMALGVGLYAQADKVGINTTSPQATLDVEGNVRVATLTEDTSADHVVVVGSNNVLSTAPISGLATGGGTTGVISTAISTGKVYTCNPKNNGTIIYTTSGALYCYSHSYNSAWYYNGLVYGADRSYPNNSFITDLRPNIENKWYKISFGLPGANNMSSSGSITYDIEFTSGSSKFMSGLPVYFSVSHGGSQNKDWSTPPLQVINDSRYKN